MANSYTQATVSPTLPLSLFSDAELELLSGACGLSSERHGDDLYFFAEECFIEEGEDEEGQTIDGLGLLQGKLRQLDVAAYPHITIHGSATCSKMREGEFGGFAYVITRDDVRSHSTWEWIATQTGGSAEAVANAALVAEVRTIRIEVRGGVVQEVSGVPPGWAYEIVDHDDRESERN